MKAELRGRIGRGTALDAYLFSFVRKAIRSVEKKKSFNYMYHINEMDNNPDADHPRTFRFESKALKSISFMQIIAVEGEAISPYLKLTQVEDADMLGAPSSECPPDKFCLVQENLLLLNHDPQEVYTFQFGSYEYTDPQDNDAYEHFLFQNFEEGLMDYAMAAAAKHTRDYQRAGFEKQLGDLEMDSLVSAEEDRLLNAAEVVMRPDFYDQNS